MLLQIDTDMNNVKSVEAQEIRNVCVPGHIMLRGHALQAPGLGPTSASRSMAAFGSPAIQMVAKPSSSDTAMDLGPSSAQAMALNNAQAAGALSALQAHVKALPQLRSPWRDSSNQFSRNSPRSAGTTADETPRTFDITLDIPYESVFQPRPAKPAINHAVSTIDPFGPFAIAAQLQNAPYAEGPAPLSRQQRAGQSILASYGATSVSGACKSQAVCDSDSERDDSECGFRDMDSDSDCGAEAGAARSNFTYDLLAATLGNQFESLLLSPDNQVPLLYNSLGRKVSAHGGVAELHEPWGRKAVFGSHFVSTGDATGQSMPGADAAI
jgi:hypothetical protein